MSNAYLNLIGGLSGDMLLSSLIDAGLDPEKLSKELNKISEIDFEISVNKTERQNLKATHTDVIVNDSIKASDKRRVPRIFPSASGWRANPSTA